MANNRISVLIDVTVDKANKALTNFRTAIKNADGAVGKFKAGASALGASLKANIVPAAAVAGAAAVKFGKDAVRAASDLAESTNAVEKAYGSAGEAVLALGKDADESAGLSKSAFNDAAVGFSAFTEKIAGQGGDVVGTLDDLVTRTADFASVMDLDVADAATTFRAALSGEQEAIKRFGIDMSAAAVEAYAMANGLIETKSELTENIKVQARYGLLMEETTKFAGDFADTSDGLANSSRILDARLENLKATIGEELIPEVERLVSIADKAAIGIEFLGSSVQNLDDDAGILETGVTILGESLMKTISPIHAVEGAWNDLSRQWTSVFGATENVNDAIQATSSLLVQESIDLALAGAARKRYIAGQEAAALAVEETNAAIEESTEAIAAKYEETVDTIETEYQAAVDAANAWAENINANFVSGSNATGVFKEAASTDIAAWSAALNDNSVAASLWKDGVVTVAERAEEAVEGMGSVVLTKLGELGPGYSDSVTALQTVSDEEFTAWLSAIQVATAESQTDVQAEFDKTGPGLAEALEVAERIRSGKMAAAAIRAEAEAKAVGRAMAAGTAQGVRDGSGAVSSAVSSMVSSAIRAGKLAAETGSPSRATAREIGEPMAQGIAVGLKEGTPTAEDAMSATVASTVTAGVPNVSTGVATGTQATTININVSGLADRDTARRLAAYIREESMLG